MGGFHIFHKEDLRKIAPLWLEYTKQVHYAPRTLHVHGMCMYMDTAVLRCTVHGACMHACMHAGARLWAFGAGDILPRVDTAPARH